MKTRFLFILLFLLAGMVQTVSAQEAASDIFQRINTLRASLGLYPYTYNGALAAAAQNQAQWMAETGNVTHTRPDGSTPRDRALAAGYNTTAVSENIYAGTMASVNDAWNFWINSSIHYAGLTSTYYTEIGVGAASTSWGSAFAIVFGNGGGPPPAPPQAAGGDDSSGSGAAAAPPSFIVGVDENGNIMHQVQPGDTIGYIALLYGYTWDDIPYLLQLNGMADARELDEGSIFLVPPHAGTYTPAPSDATATNIPTVDPAVQEAALTVDAARVMTAVAAATRTVTPLPRLPGAAQDATATPQVVAMVASPSDASQLSAPQTTPTASTVASTAAAVAVTTDGSAAPSATPTLIDATSIAAVPTNTVTNASSPASGGISPWVIAAIALQVGVLLLAGGEYVMRGRRKKR